MIQRSKRSLAVAVLLTMSCCASASPPAFRSQACAVKLNGSRLGGDITPGGASLRNTFAFEPLTRRYHFWGFVADDAHFPSGASTLRAVVHATSTDGVHFTSDSALSYAFGSASYTSYGATIDAPLDYLRAAFDTDTGTWKLFAWTENVGASVGQYNYNSSVSDLSTTAATTSVLHQGPLNSPFAGNHVGTFGLVDGKLYLRVDSLYPDGSGGGNGQFAYTDAIPPATGPLVIESNLFAGTPYCWGLATACGTTDPRIPAYVHNEGRTLKQTDGSLVTYYAFRRWDGTRADKQIWFVQSTDGGTNWSAPAGVFADGNAVTVDGQPLFATGLFSHAEAIAGPNVCRLFFSTKDASGTSVMASATTGSACDALFADGFDGCG